MKDEIAEIYQELWELGLPARAYFLLAKLHNLNLMHPDHLAAENRRARDAERKRVSRGVSTDSTDTPIILEDNKQEGGVGETNPRTPFDVLEPVVGGHRAAHIVDYRRKIRKPLNAHSASLLAKRLKSCPNPQAAADEMIERGWTSVKPEWLNKDNVVSFVSSGPKRSWAEIKAERESNQ